jgi:diphthamide biosynthesis protein 7
VNCSSHALITSSATPSIITSISSGSLALLSREDGTGEYEVEQEWKGAHDYEAWIVGWDNWQRDVFYSGGDDCKLKGWDVRMPGFATFTNKK